MPRTETPAAEMRLLIATAFALLFTLPAYGEIKVSKQKACKAQLEGLSGATTGQAVTLTLKDGKKLNGKLSVVKGTRGVADVTPESGTTCPNVVGATVEIAAKGKAAKPGSTGATAPEEPATPSKGSKFGVSLFGGYGSISVKRPEGSSASLPYGGLEMGGSGRYSLNLNPQAAIPFVLGLNRFSNSVKVQSLDNTTQSVSDYTITFSALLLRLATGFAFRPITGLRILSLLHFDYGFSGTLAYTGKHGRSAKEATRKLKSTLRYGLVAGLDYTVFKGFHLGADGAFFMGSIAEAAADPLVQPAATSFSIMGYGGLLRLGYDF